MIDERDFYNMKGTKMYIIPMEEETRDDILSIDRRTKEMLRLKHRLFIQNDWEANTAVTTMIEALIKILYTNISDNGVSILFDEDANTLDFYDLLKISATYKENEKAEKVGNINVKFAPGERVASIIADDVPDEKKEYEVITPEAAYSYPDDENRTKAMLKIDKITRKLLADKYSIIYPKDFMAISCAVVFLENLYHHIVMKLVTSGKPSVTINLNDIIEFHAIKKKDGVDIKLRPGMGAKLIIKSDEFTENDDDDDEE